MRQTTSNILMIRPLAFGYNAETAVDNVFQHRPEEQAAAEIAQKAREEFDLLVQVLRAEGVHVTVIEDTPAQVKPDAVFPNNWISFHEEGRVITYPMYSKLRRQERRDDIISTIASQYKVQEEIHLESHEDQNQYLEGTGSMVLDRVHRIAYTCISERSDPQVLEEWCGRMKYTPFTFQAMSHGKPIYHTNVMMAIASEIAIVCLDCVPDPADRKRLQESLARHREVLPITDDQVQQFAGNMLAVRNQQGEELMVMSSRALQSLTTDQKNTIENYCRIVSSPIPVIEDVGGGSARCMIAEVFLHPR